MNALLDKHCWVLNLCATINAQKECVHLTKWYRFKFLRLSKVWSMLHGESVGRFQKKNSTLYFHLLFWLFLLLFFIIIFVFLWFSFIFLMKFCNRILTNQKHELVVSNCLQNCMKKIFLQTLSFQQFKDFSFRLSTLMN